VWLVTRRATLEGASPLENNNGDLHEMSLIDLQSKNAGDWVQICESLLHQCRAARG